MESLKKGGYFLLNISDRSDIRICDKINDYIKNIGGIYVDCIGMRISKRPNSKFQTQNNKLCEPIFIWKKNN